MKFEMLMPSKQSLELQKPGRPCSRMRFVADMESADMGSVSGDLYG